MVPFFFVHVFAHFFTHFFTPFFATFLKITASLTSFFLFFLKKVQKNQKHKKRKKRTFSVTLAHHIEHARPLQIFFIKKKLMDFRKKKKCVFSKQSRTTLKNVTFAFFGVLWGSYPTSIPENP